MKKRLFRLLQVLTICALAMAMLGAGNDARKRYDRLGHGMMCMCGCNQILLECNHVGCSTSEGMTKKLHTLIDSGQGDDDIKKAFIAEYGTVVLAAPSDKGFDRVAWIMPFAIFALAVAAVVYVVRTWHRRRALAAEIVAAAAAANEASHFDDLRRRARQDTEY